MNSLSCIIIDDDEISRILVKKCVEQVSFLKLEAVCENTEQATKILAQKKIDLLFLDIEMPGTNGIDFIQSNKNIGQVIVISGKKEYAAEAFDYNVTDYVVKPVSLERFTKAAQKALTIHQNIKSETDEYLFVKKDSALIKVKIADINYIEAMADYILIYTNDNRYTVLSTMKSIESKLPAEKFIRAHRSFIVQANKISSIENNSLTIGTITIPISRANKQEVIQKIKQA